MPSVLAVYSAVALCGALVLLVAAIGAWQD